MNAQQNWPRVCFGDVVKLNKDRCADPLDAGIERYVGLEHIEPEDLRIRRWGNVADGTTFTNYFRPGQVLFGKRRAYQRKVALADFEGVCSGDIYVLESKDVSVLLPELLPFLCQTEGFFEHAVGTSAGSLSPRTNWTQLAQYEFALPPLEEQRRIAEVLNGVSTVRESYLDLISASEKIEAAYLLEVFGDYRRPNQRFARVGLCNLAHIQSGVAKGKIPSAGKTSEVRYVAVSNVQDGYLDLSDVKYITVFTDQIHRYLLKPGDVLITEGGDPDKLGRGAVWQGQIEPCVHQNHVFALRTDPELLIPMYLAAVLRSAYSKQYFLSCAKRTSNLATINKKQVSDFLVPLPSLPIQNRIVQEWQAFSSIDNRTASLKDKLKQIRLLILQKIMPVVPYRSGCT